MKYLVTCTSDNGEQTLMSEKSLIKYAKNYKRANEDFPKTLKLDNVEDAIKGIEWAGDEVKKITKEEYYICLAKDELGSACRDNSREELIDIGKSIEDGTFTPDCE